MYVSLFLSFIFIFFFFNDTATTEIYTLSLHDALPISGRVGPVAQQLQLVRSPLLQRRGRDRARRDLPHSRLYPQGVPEPSGVSRQARRQPAGRRRADPQRARVGTERPALRDAGRRI